MAMSKSYWVKTWRLAEGQRLSESDAQYLIDCNLHVNTKTDAASIRYGNSSYDVMRAFEVDVTTMNDQEESAFLLRFAGRCSLVNMCQINTNYYSFNYES